MQKKYDIDILEFLHTLSLEIFTVADVTGYLLEVYKTTFEKKKYATQFVYRHLKLFEKQGLICIVAVTRQKAIVFCWSEKGKLIAEERGNVHAEYSNYRDVVDKLQKKISKCKAAMYTNVGEVEAYSEWIAEMPMLAKDIEQHHQYKRDRARLMEGKVKGFERLLAKYQMYV